MHEEFDGFFFGECGFGLDVFGEVSFIAIFEDEVEVVGCFLDVEELDDVFIIAGSEDFDLVFE